MCTFCDKPADRLHHWIGLEGTICSHWLVFALNHVRMQQHKISDNIWRLSSLNKIEEVDVLNPGREEIISSVIIPQKSKVNKFIVTIGSCPDTLQRAGMTQEEKMKAKKNLANLKATSDGANPMFYIQGNNKNETYQLRF